MDENERATLVWTQELLATLIRRMAGAGILSEHGADALAEETRQHIAAKLPQFAPQFFAHSQALRRGVREECEAMRSR